jgi:hypothetical protein
MGFFLRPHKACRAQSSTNGYPDEFLPRSLNALSLNTSRTQAARIAATSRSSDLGIRYATSVPCATQQVFNPREERVNDWRTMAMEDRPACISITDVQHAVARAFCLSISEMLSRKRRHRLTGARQVVMYLSREMAGGGWMGRRRQAASFPRIGMAFARDHTSVIHACNVVARRRLADADFAQLLDRIARELTAAALKPAGAA